MANTKSFYGTSVAKRRRGPTALEQIAWLRLGPGLASRRDLHQVSLHTLSGLHNSASLCWRSTGHFQDTYRFGCTFWNTLRTIFPQLNMVNTVLMPKDDAGCAQRQELPECWLTQHSSRSMWKLNNLPRYYSLWADLFICLASLLVPASRESKKHPMQN